MSRVVCMWYDLDGDETWNSLLYQEGWTNMNCCIYWVIPYHALTVLDRHKITLKTWVVLCCMCIQGHVLFCVPFYRLVNYQIVFSSSVVMHLILWHGRKSGVHFAHKALYVGYSNTSCISQMHNHLGIVRMWYWVLRLPTSLFMGVEHFCY